MSVRIFKDIEEALTREVRRLTYHDNVTQTDTVLQDAFDPITGEIVQIPLEPQFYDSSANTQSIDYPNIYVKLLRSREDRFSNRNIPQYGRNIKVPVTTAPRAYDIIANGSDGDIDIAGNDLVTSLLKIQVLQPGNLLRILSGNNKGTYTIASITPDSGGSHVITVSNTLVASLPALVFNSVSREVVFSDAVDLNTVKVGDQFTDFSSTVFNITAIDKKNNSITIDGGSAPDISADSSISRTGDVFEAEVSLVRFIVMDQTKPLTLAGTNCDATSSFENVSPDIPLDIYYLIRIDSKERQTHIEILNRMWEEFNPPRTGLPVVVRSEASAETLLSADVAIGGSQTLSVESTEKFSIGDSIVIFDDLTPSKDVTSEGFESLFESKVTNVVDANTIEVEDVVPDTFLYRNCPKIVSNATLRILMFHFVDHKTRDIESAQYWVHEFTFWVQATVKRLGEPVETGVVTDIEIVDPIELSIDDC